MTTWLLSALLVVSAALVGACAGWLFRGDRDRRRAYRHADAIMRLAREEDAELRGMKGRGLSWYDRDVLIEAHYDPRLSSHGGEA